MTVSRLTRILLIGMAACLAAGLTAGPALAAATWRIEPGGAVALGPGPTTIKDTKTGATIPCNAARLTGTLKSGGGLPGAGAGSLSGGAINGCGGPLGLTFTITLLDLPWHINLVSFNAGTGLVRGTISHMEIGAAAAGCGFVIDGTRGGASDGMVNFTYGDRTHKVKISGGNLHIFNANGCVGLVANGDPVSLTASLPLTPVQTITSP